MTGAKPAITIADEVPFPEPFGPEYVRPPGEPCPDCECCSLRLCQLAASKYVPCSHLSDDRQRVSGCPCSTIEAQARIRAGLAKLR